MSANNDSDFNNKIHDHKDNYGHGFNHQDYIYVNHINIKLDILYHNHDLKLYNG